MPLDKNKHVLLILNSCLTIEYNKIPIFLHTHIYIYITYIYYYNSKYSIILSISPPFFFFRIFSQRHAFNRSFSVRNSSFRQDQAYRSRSIVPVIQHIVHIPWRNLFMPRTLDRAPIEVDRAFDTDDWNYRSIDSSKLLNKA